MKKIIEFHVFAIELYSDEKNKKVNSDRKQMKKYIIYEENGKKYYRCFTDSNKFSYYNERIYERALKSENGTKIHHVKCLFEYDHFLVNGPALYLKNSTWEFIKFVLREYMPFGILDLKVFPIAREILNQYTDDEKKFQELFKLIPMKFVPENKTAKKIMLDKLQNVVEALYKAIDSGEDSLHHFCEQFLRIKISEPKQNTDYENMKESFADLKCYDVKNIFKVEKCEAKSNLTSGSAMRLFHSTYCNQMLNILKDGLRIGSNLPDVKQPETKRAKEGIYFSEKPYMEKFHTQHPTVLILYCTVDSPKLYGESKGHYVVRKEEQVTIDYIIELVTN
ncbi:uncharacterized protein LOC129567966 isoform X1 [Sitodiplosis mosellana]|uniref:uncharacterized protein LOC129567966 isoform X1 n=1 Tax=Sitodiplosis mosellana TaxID=263140 RepID=UPI002444C34B|nr:uncharacterized protein LOC129567966 isoform X1 [Sitodiplosis mosellana]